MFQTVDINIVPTGECPVVNVSQYDINRVIRFCLLNDGEAYHPTNLLKIEFIIRKVDGTLVTQETDIMVSNVVELFTTEQMTACAGKNIGEIRLFFNDPDISEDDVKISTLNFILEVERSPETGGIESESEIANLNGQIASIVDEQLNNYYTKSEIDAQIEDIVTEQVTPIVAGIVSEQVPPIVESELSNYYTKDETDTYFYNKTETDTLLSGKADVSDLPDMSDYYTSDQTDTLLAGKVSNSTLNNYYNKTEVDTLIAGVSTDFTSSITTPASVQTFNDGGDNIPLKSCEVAIVASQSGSGTPSPSNPRSISGHSSITVTVSDGDSTTQTTTIPLGQTVYGGSLECVSGSGQVTKAFYDLANYSGTVTRITSGGVADRTYFRFDDLSPYPLSLSSGGSIISDKYEQVTITASTTDVGISIGLPSALGHTTVFFRPENPNSYTEATIMTYIQNTLGGLQICYDVATPTSLSVSGANIPTLSGTNNIYADSGDVQSLEYFNDKADDIASMVRLMTRS